MSLNVNETQLAAMGVKSPSGWVAPLNAVIDKLKLDSKEKIAMFLSQCMHESNCFSVLVENLNYSEQGLLKVFPKYFDAATAKRYARQPQWIASRVYGGRMGNGNEQSQDGWKYRGKGLIQITGKANHKMIGDVLGVDLVANPDLLIQPLYAVLSAGVFWEKNNLASYSDINVVTKKINGGFNGLADRVAKYDLCMKVLSK